MKRGVGRGLTGVLLATAAVCGLTAMPASAGQYYQVPMEIPYHAPSSHQLPQIYHGPVISHRNQGPAMAVQRIALSTVMASLDSATRPVSPMAKKAALEKRKKELEKKKAELEKKLAKFKDDFLKSKDGKDAKKKIDEEAKKRDKKIRDAINERNMKQGENCCGLGERQKWESWLQKKMREAWDDFNKAEKKIFEDEFKKKNPKKFKKYDKAKNELEDTNKKSKDVANELENLNEPSTAEVQP
jgi:hypothetical protein